MRLPKFNTKQYDKDPKYSSGISDGKMKDSNH
uniref:Uncharacterized protein n=1 Tax=Anguilla anguilla TaxID=7936 RepID=A0A0E9V6S3_ANGAN